MRTMRARGGLLAVAMLAAIGAGGAAVQPQPATTAPAPAGVDVLGFTVKDIDGAEQSLSQYRGKVVVIVNVASKCGFTSQYAGLQKLYDERKDKGLVVLGFPANNFMGQEPGSEADIKSFCTSTYGVTFPMFAKVSAKGDDAHPLYRALAGLPEPLGGAPKWNFTKFVVDRDGKVVARVDAQRALARKADLEPELLKAVDEALARPRAGG